MVRIRSGWLVAVAVLALGVTACKKNDEKKGDQAATGDKTTEKGPAGDKTPTVVANMAGAASDDLALLPVDSEVVMGINIAQLQQSALWKQFAPKLMEKMASGLAEFKASCGFDPLEAIKSISIGMKGLGGGADKPDGAVVIHGPEKAKVMACLDKAKAEAAKKGNELTVDGDVFTTKDKNGNLAAFTFTNDNTLLGTMGPTGTKDGVLAAAKGTSALKTSATFVELYSKIKTDESLWFLVNGNSPMFNKMGSMGVKPKAVYGSINLTDGLTVDLRMRVATPDEAASFVKTITPQISNPQIKQFIDKLDVNADGSDVKFSMAMTNQKLQQLIGMVGGMMGGMMGGGMGGP